MNTGVHFFWTHLIDTPSLQSAWVVPECGTTWLSEIYFYQKLDEESVENTGKSM